MASASKGEQKIMTGKKERNMENERRETWKNKIRE